MLLLALMSLSAAVAQELKVPYFHGFEDTEENKNWKVESVTDNRWTVGTAEKSDGTHSMYVSFDGGTTAGTSDHPGFISVYREITLPDREIFEVSFDWKNIGVGGGELYVCWFPADDEIDPYSKNVYDLPGWLKDGRQVTQFISGDSVFNQSAPFSSSSLWRNVTFEVRGTGMPSKLLFFFRSRTTSVHKESGRTFSAACIDNIQITNKYACSRPRDIQYAQTDASRGVISWEGDAGPFSVQYCKVDTVIKWTTVENIGYPDNFNNTTQRYECPVRALRKGAYIVKVKQICEALDGSPADTSAWTTKDVLVYYSDNSCLNFLDLYDEDAVSCYAGTTTNLYGGGPIPPIDYGYADERSRHTVHYDPNEFDKWSNYNLRTTPGDGLPAVRLGNYNVQYTDNGKQEGYTEVITYHYYVDPDAPLLLIKFAMMLEDAKHGGGQDPQFNLVISDYATGEDLSHLLCGRVNFEANFDDPAYRQGANTTHDRSPVMLYKEWTTIGMDLQPIAGKTIDISFESIECALGGHASWVYFTMDCMGAKISGVGCGDDMFGAIEAPDGFRYKWYPRKLIDENRADSAAVLQKYFDDPDFKDTLKTYTPPVLPPDQIAEGDGIYVCRIISKEEEDCWFELRADLDPRDVYAKAVLDSVVYRDCEARAYFTNKSYTKTRNRGEIGRCDYFQWDAGTGKIITDEHPFIVLPPGEHHIRLDAFIDGSDEDNPCTEYWDTTIVIEDYGASRDTLRVRRCTADPSYTWAVEDGGTGKTYTVSDTIMNEAPDFAGCIDTFVLDFVVSEEIDIELFDTTDTESTPYRFFEQSLYETGTYHATVTGQDGDCDTLYTLHLSVMPVLRLNFDPDSLPYACYGETDTLMYDYSVRTGTLETFDLHFDDFSLQAGFSNLDSVPDSVAAGTIRIAIPPGALPGSYPAKITFDGDTTGIEEFDINVDIFYSATIMQQKWNDVIALYNSDRNGGHTFDSYSWYRDGELIPGENGSYLYINGSDLSFTSEYQALVRRTSDGVTTFTCPIIPSDRSGSFAAYPTVSVTPTQAAPGSRVEVHVSDGTPLTAEIFDATGRLHSRHHITPDHTSAHPSSTAPTRTTLTMPPHPGLYIIRFTFPDGTVTSTKIMLH